MDIERLLVALGFTARNAIGSHVTFKRPGVSPITVPRQRPIRRIYVEEVVKLVLRVLGETP